MSARHSLAGAFVALHIAASTMLPAVAATKASLEGSAWASDEAKDCFVMGLELRPKGKASAIVTSMDELEGKWAVTGNTLNATLYLDANHPPLVLKAVLLADTMKATYTWNEGTDGGPDKEECELRRIKK